MRARRVSTSRASYLLRENDKRFGYKLAGMRDNYHSAIAALDIKQGGFIAISGCVPLALGLDTVSVHERRESTDHLGQSSRLPNRF